MKKVKKDPIPELKVLKKPSKGCNNGFYEVIIPLKYMVDAYKVPAAFFSFRFIGLKGYDHNAS